MGIVNGDTRQSQLEPINRIFQGSIHKILQRFKAGPELEALYQQLRDPNSDGDGEVGGLKTSYDPNRASATH